MTVIHGRDAVEKRAVYPEGEEHVKAIAGNLADLKVHGIAVVEARIEQNHLVMPYIREKTRKIVSVE